MASEPKTNDQGDTVLATRSPRAVEGGTEHLESLGRFVDDLMGDSRLRARIRTESEPLVLREDEMPEDPPASEPPPPVPGGTEDVTKGRRPEGEQRS